MTPSEETLHQITFSLTPIGTAVFRGIYANGWALLLLAASVPALDQMFRRSAWLWIMLSAPLTLDVGHQGFE